MLMAYFDKYAKRAKTETIPSLSFTPVLHFTGLPGTFLKTDALSRNNRFLLREILLI